MNSTFARALGVERLSVVTLKPAETKTAFSQSASRNSHSGYANVRGKALLS